MRTWLLLVGLAFLGILGPTRVAGQVEGQSVTRPTERVVPSPEVNPDAVVWRTPQRPSDPQAGDVWISPQDGAEMVWIPPGEFTMGSPEGQGGSDAHPQHRVYLDGYWIYQYEVTNEQYQKFVQATGRSAPDHWTGGKIPSGLEKHPVVNVDWEDATAYCQWAGVRLPTEAEWEKAARGTEGRIYPWGNQWDAKKCNSGESGDGFANTAPVGSFPAGASPYGVMDMAGNVWEWCSDWYEANYYQSSPARNPTGPDSGQYRVLRGGAWFNIVVGYYYFGVGLSCRSSNRFWVNPSMRNSYIFGFRCVPSS